MTSFYPGPSQVYPQVPKWVLRAYEQGFLSINHRSEEFERLVDQVHKGLKRKLEMPDNYRCFFVSSATECWEIIAQSLVAKNSFHIYNGAFGKKWFETTKKLKPNARSLVFEPDQPLPAADLPSLKDVELIAVTHNETSNGTMVHADILSSLRRQYPDKLLAVDVTSSLAGVQIPWNAADVWFASVQKCLGLPAGMGLLICSPAAIAKAKELDDNKFYNSLNNLVFHMGNLQTTHTPNVLNIYLLSRVLKKVKKIEAVHRKTHRRYQRWMAFIDSLKTMQPLSSRTEVRSPTVLALQGEPEIIEQVWQESKAHGFVLGKGYGDLKAVSLRIANFPAIRNKQVKALQKFWVEQNY